MSVCVRVLVRTRTDACVHLCVRAGAGVCARGCLRFGGPNVVDDFDVPDGRGDVDGDVCRFVVHASAV